MAPGVAGPEGPAQCALRRVQPLPAEAVVAARAAAGHGLPPAQLAFAAQQLVLRHFQRDAGDVLCAAVAHWVAVCRRTRALWRCRIAAVSRRVRRLASAALGALCDHAAARRAAARDATRALLHAAGRVQRAGLRGWQEWRAGRAAKCRDMQRALQHRASCLVRSAQRWWLAAAAESAAGRHRVEACAHDVGLRRRHRQQRLVRAQSSRLPRVARQPCVRRGHRA